MTLLSYIKVRLECWICLYSYTHGPIPIYSYDSLEWKLSEVLIDLIEEPEGKNVENFT